MDKLAKEQTEKKKEIRDIQLPLDISTSLLVMLFVA